MLSQLYTEYLALPGLFDVVFPAEMDPKKTLAASMQTEVLSLVNRIALQEAGDLRTLFSTRSTSVDANLASFYGLPARRAAFQSAMLPDTGPRAGILTPAP